jgi:hypothetical protein
MRSKHKNTEFTGTYGKLKRKAAYAQEVAEEASTRFARMRIDDE